MSKNYKTMTNLIVIIQSNGLEVLQLPQIPQLQRAILSTYNSITPIKNKYKNKVGGGRRHASLTSSKVVSVLGEGDGGDWARVTREVGHIGALLQIPNLNLRVCCTSAENQAVRMELSTGQSCSQREEEEVMQTGKTHTMIFV